MIPEENNEAAGAMTNLMSNEKRKLTLDNIANNQDAAAGRLRSGLKRFSEPVVGSTAAAGGGGYQNPWGNSKKSSLPGSLRELGSGLNCKQIVIIVKIVTQALR